MHRDETNETISAMTNPEMIERVRELRQRGRTPKEIARTLGLPRAEAASLIRTVAAARPTREAALVGCWVNHNWSAGLTVTGHSEWPGVGAAAESAESGLVNVLVARETGSRVSACGYLVDAWCLGVKNALGPRSMDRRKLPEFRAWFFRSYDQPPLVVPIELARHLVFGAVQYARELGFEPHPDFAGCAGHLGAWDSSSDITFGHEGKPMYIQGPYDDAARIIRTLRRSVGDDNFHYLTQFG
jgi:hypothetical protein